MNKKIVFFLFSILQLTICNSQEVLRTFSINPKIAIKYAGRKNFSLKKNPAILDTISLPFFDDFSKEDIYPDASLWLDSNVFINRDYPIAPPTLGVATFDGVSKSGCPYDSTLLSVASKPADTLTSKPINLSLLPSDSVFLTFFWQAKGRGNPPEHSDSLILQFKNPSLPESIAWNTVWFKNGYNPTGNDTVFRLQVIPIADTAYLKNGFQFRFRNYATTSGNVDHWHIDYVLLDKNRSMHDTIFDDVAFAYNTTSLLKNYYAMPWEQYQPSEMKSSLSFLIRSNDTTYNAVTQGKNISFTDTIFDISGNVQCSYNGGADNVLPYYKFGLITNPQFATPTLSDNPPSYSFPSLTQDTSFFLKADIYNVSPDKNFSNNTLRFTQNFHNYYAYDDGTVEAGYGLIACGTPGQIAYKFTLNQADTLYALKMLWDWIGPDVNQQQFKIRIWNDNAGTPGTLRYEDTIRTPDYWFVYHPEWGNLTNEFFPYVLKTKQALGAGSFYIGFVQYVNPCSTLVNLGLDLNTNSNNKMWFDDGNGWQQSQLGGSWMMRPVFGNMKGLQTVHEIESQKDFKIFPNPCDGKFQITFSKGEMERKEISLDEKTTIEIYNSLGEKIYFQNNFRYTSLIDISNEQPGIYFIRLTDEKGIAHSQKFILSK